jgi:hypothetical protein
MLSGTVGIAFFGAFVAGNYGSDIFLFVKPGMIQIELNV